MYNSIVIKRNERGFEMKYIDEVQGDIVTEEEMNERMYEYIDFNDLAETLQYVPFKKIWENLSEEMRLKIFDKTKERLIEDSFYFSEYEDEDDEE